MLQESWNALFCPYCNAIVEGKTEREARDAMAQHQQYVQCIKGY
jgi:hypothetical protein